MKPGLALIRWMISGLILVACAWSQSDVVQEPNKETGAGRQIGSGAGRIGTGAAKGAGDLAKGTAKGAVSLATLHPIDAGVSMGRGVASAGKDVATGTVTGTGRIAKGIGRAFHKVL